MSDIPSPSAELLCQAVDGFWETVPSFWHKVRAYIRTLAEEQHDITVEQFHILRHIRQGICLASEIAEAKRISRPAISQAVELLVQKGLVVRRQNPDDRREVQLSLTPAGDALLDALFDRTRQWMAGLFTSLSDAELQAIIAAMKALNKTTPA
jgi:MarR family 2-MHQ and catechol resistance regulon transcriptional repressor